MNAHNIGELMRRLEEHYDFKCEAGDLADCREWYELKQAVLTNPQPTTTGYAVVHRGVVLVSTVSERDTGAMVNWLVTACGFVVTSNWTDDVIRSAFNGRKAQVTGPVEVMPVQIEVMQ